MYTIPLDVLNQIISKLDIYPALHFRCVSKHFSKAHNRVTLEYSSVDNIGSAIKNNYMELINQLISNPSNKYNISRLLLMCMWNNNTTIFRFLLNKYPNTYTFIKMCGINIAIRYNALDIIKYLTKSAGLIFTPDNLSHAVTEKRPEIVKWVVTNTNVKPLDLEEADLYRKCLVMLGVYIPDEW